MNNNLKHNIVAQGVSTCAGCGLDIAIRRVLNVLGEETIIVIPPGCAALFSGYGNCTAMKIPGFQGNLENTAAYAAGIRSGLEAQGKNNINVVGFAGDGATVDIGLQSLSGVLERGEKVIYVCYDNEAYMNTGNQRSGSTPLNATTKTTPGSKLVPKKNMLEIVMAHHIPYVASASIGYIKDLERKVQKAKDVQGPSYIHIHTPCPTGWGFEPHLTVEIARKAVLSGMWELFEVIDGNKVSTMQVTNSVTPEEYMCEQRRFK
ncbi:thiamine pyrophosphate-dependent enzyme [Cellulosilyticum ruminicola]|uniref:thiamine pyrophosphate-dependent enzyme n=1 Tax=Cellulosilyticum ruminicola TaxID=425254 RepID=UPI0009F8F9C8|nr:thiamine pyrophosphate-dependent enzyme [Cellulosilyticum ruminicola]